MARKVRAKAPEAALDRDSVLRELTSAAERFVNKAPKSRGFGGNMILVDHAESGCSGSSVVALAVAAAGF
jgi:hypothetical protein